MRRPRMDWPQLRSQPDGSQGRSWIETDRMQQRRLQPVHTLEAQPRPHANESNGTEVVISAHQSDPACRMHECSGGEPLLLVSCPCASRSKNHFEWIGTSSLQCPLGGASTKRALREQKDGRRMDRSSSCTRWTIRWTADADSVAACPPVSSLGRPTLHTTSHHVTSPSTSRHSTHDRNHVHEHDGQCAPQHEHADRGQGGYTHRAQIRML